MVIHNLLVTMALEGEFDDELGAGFGVSALIGETFEGEDEEVPTAALLETEVTDGDETDTILMRESSMTFLCGFMSLQTDLITM